LASFTSGVLRGAIEFTKLAAKIENDIFDGESKTREYQHGEHRSDSGHNSTVEPVSDASKRSPPLVFLSDIRFPELV